MQKSIIEFQSIATFLITDFFSFVYVPAIAKFILIKEHSRFFISNKQMAEIMDTVRRPFLKATMFESMQCY